jgi:hypothetical protein
VVTIALGGAQATEIAEEEAEAWGVAQDAAAHIQACFPAFFAEHVASWPATLPGGLSVACAFFALVEQRGLELRWPASNTWSEGPGLKDELGTLSPEEWLTTFGDVSDEYLSILSYWLFQPRPVYHGWNVQTGLGGDEAQAREAGRQAGHIALADMADDDGLRWTGLTVDLGQHLAQDGGAAAGGDADGDVHAVMGVGCGVCGERKPPSRPRKLCQ